MGKHSGAEMRALGALESSLEVANRTGDNIELVGHGDSRRVHAEWIDIAKRVNDRAAGGREARPSRWARYAWALWAVPTALACAAGIATVIYLLAST